MERWKLTGLLAGASSIAPAALVSLLQHTASSAPEGHLPASLVSDDIVFVVFYLSWCVSQTAFVVGSRLFFQRIFFWVFVVLYLAHGFSYSADSIVYQPARYLLALTGGAVCGVSIVLLDITWRGTFSYAAIPLAICVNTALQSKIRYSAWIVPTLLFLLLYRHRHIVDAAINPPESHSPPIHRRINLAARVCDGVAASAVFSSRCIFMGFLVCRLGETLHDQVEVVQSVCMLFGCQALIYTLSNIAMARLPWMFPASHSVVCIACLAAYAISALLVCNFHTEGQMHFTMIYVAAASFYEVRVPLTARTIASNSGSNGMIVHGVFVSLVTVALVCMFSSMLYPMWSTDSPDSAMQVIIIGCIGSLLIGIVAVAVRVFVDTNAQQGPFLVSLGPDIRLVQYDSNGDGEDGSSKVDDDDDDATDNDTSRDDIVVQPLDPDTRPRRLPQRLDFD